MKEKLKTILRAVWSWRTVGLSGIRVFERAMDIPAFLDNTAP